MRTTKAAAVIENAAQLDVSVNYKNIKNPNI
jgi:hypothetical protein